MFKKCLKCLIAEGFITENKLEYFPVYMLDTFTINSSPVIKAVRSMNSFVDPIYVKEISRKLIPYG